MIPRNELRIGNWFYDGFTDRHGNLIPATVKAIPDNSSPEYTSEPIPLTSKILYNAGCVEDKNNGNYPAILIKSLHKKLIFLFDIGEVRVSMIYDNGIMTISKNCFYLHQAQNIFHSLTGEELQVNLMEDIKDRFYPFSPDSNKFVSIFFKILEGKSTVEEIAFATDYARDYLNTSDADKLDTAWEALTCVGFSRGEEFNDEDVLKMLTGKLLS